MAGLRLDADRAVVLIYYVLHYAQAYACAGLVVGRLVEGLEDALVVVGVNAYAVVGHLDGKVGVVGHDLAREAYAVARIFAGVGQQVAHHLGYRLAVDDGSEVAVGIIDPEGDAALGEGWLEAFAHRAQHVADVAHLEPHAEALVLNLAEVEQLVDEFEQTMGVAVDYVEAVALGGREGCRGFYELFQRAYDERHGSAYLVGYGGEKPYLRVSHLQLLLFVELGHGQVVAAAFPP